MFQPWDYQEMCLERISETRQRGVNRALMVMASGTGKTVTAAFDVQRWLDEHDGRVLYLCHQNDILSQARNTFEEVLGKQHKFGYFHGQEKDHHSVTCLFASLQTMREWKQAFSREEFSYIIVDESHHAPAPTYLPILEYFRPKFLLGATATPDRMDLQDIRDIYGTEVFSLPLENALAGGLLTSVDYRVMADEIQDTKGLETSLGRLTMHDLNKKLFAARRDQEIADIIYHHMKELPDPRVMIFCSSVSYCDQLAAHMPNSFPLHYRVDAGVQRMGLHAFRKGLLNTVITVDKFNEGIDVPEVNMIVFLRSTASRTIFYQQLGRGLRKAVGTNKNRVLALDFVATGERLEMLDELWRSAIEREGQVRKTTIQAGDDILEFQNGIRVHFPISTKAALEAVREVKAGYSTDYLIRCLQELAGRFRRTPTLRDMKDAYKQGLCPGLPVFYRHFGPFKEAVKAAKLPEEEVEEKPRKYSPKERELLSQLMILANNLGRRPAVQDIEVAKRKGNFPTYMAFCEAFGSFGDALDAAKIPKR